MQQQWVCVAFLALVILTVVGAEDGKSEKQGKKVRKSDCGDWQWSVCVAIEGDCGEGTREGTRTGASCKQTMKTQRCKIPCNWKKKFGGECKYDFKPWGECVEATGVKSRAGNLKRAFPHANCPLTVTVNKPCGKTKRMEVMLHCQRSFSAAIDPPSWHKRTLRTQSRLKEAEARREEERASPIGLGVKGREHSPSSTLCISLL